MHSLHGVQAPAIDLPEDHPLALIIENCSNYERPGRLKHSATSHSRPGRHMWLAIAIRAEAISLSSTGAPCALNKEITQRAAVSKNTHTVCDHLWPLTSRYCLPARCMPSLQSASQQLGQSREAVAHGQNHKNNGLIQL
jgi:hypothetical protein